MIHLEISNGKLVSKGYEDLGGAVPKIGRLTLYRAAQRIFKRLGIYAHKLPGQVYKRTLTARRSRAITRTDKGYLVTFNPIHVSKKGRQHPYGVYLRGSPGSSKSQAKYHQGRWEPFALITQEELAKLPAEVRAALKEVADQAAEEMKGGR